MFVRGVIVYYYNFDATGVEFNTIRPTTKNSNKTKVKIVKTEIKKREKGN